MTEKEAIKELAEAVLQLDRRDIPKYVPKQRLINLIAEMSK